MKKVCVVLDGKVLNHGPWEHVIYVKDVDYREVAREVEREIARDVEREVDGKIETVIVKELVTVIEIEMEPFEIERPVPNPFPEGAVEGEFEVEWTSDGRVVLATDYVAKRRAEYPSIGEQLDALFKAGAFPPEMAKRLQAVKDKHPK